MSDDCACKGVIGNQPPGTGAGSAEEKLPTGYITGLLHAQAGAAQILILGGSCRDEDDTFNIINIAPKVAVVTITGANGRNSDTAEQANKWYAVCIIAKSSDGTIAGFLVNEDDWASSYTMPSGYDKIRRIGWARNNSSSDFYDYISFAFGQGRTVKYNETYLDLRVLISGNATSFTDVDCSEFVPPDTQLTEIIARIMSGGTGTNTLEIRYDGSGNADPPMNLISEINESLVAVYYQRVNGPDRVMEYKVFHGSGDAYINVLGYIDEV